MTTQQLSYYLDRYATGEITAEEWIQLQQLLRKGDHDTVIDELLDTELQRLVKHQPTDTRLIQDIQQGLQHRIRFEVETQTSDKKLFQIYKSPWLRYAAAILVVLAAVISVWLTNQKQYRRAVASLSQHNHIGPGKDGAVLTLADGRQIVLDSLQNGIVATDNGTDIILTNGALSYGVTNAAAQVVSYNIMATPKGRQYQLILPDKSRVWLNAASSIRYPTSFDEDHRTVELTGEAFFEVEKNKSRPFNVKLNSGVVIEVLGTSFNVNAYDKEPTVNTTLITGSIRVTADGRVKIISPGQQAQYSENSLLTVADQVNIPQVIAWKNGYFDFNNADLPVMMRHLERWYDIEVRYAGQIPEISFRGKMDRNVQLTDVIEFLKSFGVKAELYNRILTISAT